MEKIIIVISCFLLLSCGATKKEITQKKEKSFTIKKNGNWKDGFVCGSELGLIRKGELNKREAYFGVYVKETDQSLYDFIKHENDIILDYYIDIEVNAEKKETVNGTCYIVNRRYKQASISPNIDKHLCYYYKYNGKIYTLRYDTTLKLFDKYLPEVKQMMNTFKIIKN